MSSNEITLTAIYEILKDHTARFDRMDERFNRLDQRFDAMDQRLGSSDKRVDSLEAKFDRFESVQNSMALRLISVETTVKEHSAMLQTMQLRLDSLHGLAEKLERRTGRIEQEYVLEQRFDRMAANRLQERIAALEARVQALETAQA
jgi:chromosome segregation ATPase